MSKSYSGTITIGVEQPDFDSVVASAQEAAAKLNGIAGGLNETQEAALNDLSDAAKKSAATQNAAFDDVAKARSRDADAIEAEKNATVAAFAEMGQAAEKNAQAEEAASKTRVAGLTAQTKATVDAIEAEKNATVELNRQALAALDAEANFAARWAELEPPKRLKRRSPRRCKNTPTLLNGAGAELAPGASPVYRTFRVNPWKDFGALNLPNLFDPR